MRVSQRLTEVGIELPEVVAPVAAYAPAKRHGDLVFTAGQLPMVAGQLPQTGKVGGQVSVERGAELARQCALNGVAAAASVLGSVDELTGVLKVLGFVNSAPDFTGPPNLITGSSSASK